MQCKVIAAQLCTRDSSALYHTQAKQRNAVTHSAVLAPHETAESALSLAYRWTVAAHLVPRGALKLCHTFIALLTVISSILVGLKLDLRLSDVNTLTVSLSQQDC